MENKEKTTLSQAMEILVNQVSELKKTIEELQNEPGEQGKWQDKLVQPSKSKYYYICSSCDEGLQTYSDYNTGRKPEHAFETREQAQLVEEKMLLMQEMLAFAHVRNGGWEPVWGDGSKKYGIATEGDTVFTTYCYNVNNFVFGIAVKSIKIAEEMLDTFRERIKEYYNKQY